VNINKLVKKVIKKYKQNGKLTEKEKKKFIKKINNDDWFYISGSQELSEGFIREFQDKVDWLIIFKYQKLSEDFIDEFKNKVKWISIFSCQKLSKNFIMEFEKKVDWKGELHTK